MFTVIPYLYRDAANYKQANEIVLDGELSSADIAAIESKLSDGEYFIPGDLAGLGVEELQPRSSGFPSTDDHVYHELELGSLEVQATVPEGTVVLSKDEFLKAFEAISNSEAWDVAGCMARLDLPA
jgi:hypothetical protein